MERDLMKRLRMLLAPVAVVAVLAGCSSDPAPEQGDNKAAMNSVSSDSPEMQAKAAARARGMATPTASGSPANLRSR